ncbi:hypothetical protein M1D89_09655 [Arthrobacter sp. D3-18]
MVLCSDGGVGWWPRGRKHNSAGDYATGKSDRPRCLSKGCPGGEDIVNEDASPAHQFFAPSSAYPHGSPDPAGTFASSQPLLTTASTFHRATSRHFLKKPGRHVPDGLGVRLDHRRLPAPLQHVKDWTKGQHLAHAYEKEQKM